MNNFRSRSRTQRPGKCLRIISDNMRCLGMHHNNKKAAVWWLESFHKPA